MAMKTAWGADALVTDINVTPLVDIMLVLLIIFMLTSSAVAAAKKPDVIDVDLPTAASSATVEESPPVSLVINKTRQLFLDCKAITRAALKTEVSARVARQPKGVALTAVLSSDRGVDHGTVVGLIDGLRTWGIKDVAINTKAQDIE